jgi:hypothetical protein
VSGTTYAPNRIRELAIACADDWPRLMFDGFGIMVSDQQIEAYNTIGKPGPRGPSSARRSGTGCRAASAAARP